MEREAKETSTQVPLPAPMPVDREEWRQRLNLSNFVNTYYQYRDITELGDCRTILLVGPGQGLDTAVLKWRGFQVTTLDIDATFRPDHIGSVHDLTAFRDGAFDVILASHVLEHLPLPYLDGALAEMARVARYALVYLPVHGRHVQMRFVPGLRAFDLSVEVDLFNYLERPDGLEPRYMARQHFWEVGMRGFRVRDLRRRFGVDFSVVKDYRNRDWLPSYNFVLRSRRRD